MLLKAWELGWLTKFMQIEQRAQYTGNFQTLAMDDEIIRDEVMRRCSPVIQLKIKP